MAASSQQNQPASSDLLRRPLYLYDLPPDVLASLTLKLDTDVSTSLSLERDEQQSQKEPTEAEDGVSSPREERPERALSPAPKFVVGSQACSMCGLSFSTVEEQRSHLKSDWHHYNLKQKLRGQKPVPENEFERLLGDLDESLSGSDSSDSEDESTGSGAESSKTESTLVALLKKQAILADKTSASSKKGDGDDDDDGGGGRGKRKRQRGTGSQPMIWFASTLLPENTFFGMYKAVFTPEELSTPEETEKAVKGRQLAPIAMPKPGAGNEYKGPHVFLCMMGGGHYAAMVVALAPRKSSKHSSTMPMNREATVLAHKTFHRYTTRRKQGGSQSANDNAKGNAHSAGSSLRRYNEQALVEDVRALLAGWKGLLDTADLLFIRANGTTNKRTLFGPYEGQVLRSDDSRIRGFPFTTRRATQNELMRAFIKLTRLEVREIVPVTDKPEELSSAKTSASTTAGNVPPSPSVPLKLTEEEETAQLHTSQMQALVRRSKLPALLSYMKINNLVPDFRLLLPPPQHHEVNHHAPTVLHLAASLNSAPLVSGLLVRGGADPTIRNGEGKTPFELAGDRATRDAFRVARAELGEDKWAWGDDGDNAGAGARVPSPLSREEADQRDKLEKKREAERKKAEEEKLRQNDAPPTRGGGAAASSRKGLIDSTPAKSAQEKREDDVRGLTPEQKMRLERERRARAAEERIRRMQQQ